jgi:Flp pilus assembly protein TadG
MFGSQLFLKKIRHSADERVRIVHRMKAKPRQRGYIVVMLALAMVTICGFAGLVVDAGFGEYVKRQAQAAADAGAKAAAYELAAGRTGSISAAALQDTANNGFTNGTQNVTVTVNRPPASGAYASKSSYVEVIVAKTINTTLMSVLGFRSVTVRARSVATGGSVGNCIYVMNSSASSALKTSGTGTITTSCGIFVNSSASPAATLSGSASISAPSINIVGGYSVSGGGASFNPTPTTGVATSSDPLASVPAPAVGTCTYTNTRITSSATLNPGVYCGGITLTAQANVALNAGTYILLGGGLSLAAPSQISGSGITFYNTYDSTHSFSGISFSGGSQGTLSAPTTGPLAGILFFEDRSVSGSNNSFTGNSSSSLTGALYFLKSGLTYSGDSSTGTPPAYTIIVADQLTLTGNGTVGSDYTSLPGGSPLKSGVVFAE